MSMRFDGRPCQGNTGREQTGLASRAWAAGAADAAGCTGDVITSLDCQ